MCVVVVKNKGVEFPAKELIENCCERNPEGFAMAWNEGGRLKVYKTMSQEMFLKRYAEVVKRCDPAETGMVLHARIATHGSKNIKNCHCWTGSGFAFAHNGILHNIGSRKDMTDSETFFRDYFEPVYKKLGWDMAEKVIDLAIGGSKFAFIDKNGDIHKYGRYETHEGVFYSNNSWQTFKSYARSMYPSLFAPRGNYKSKYESRKATPLIDMEDGLYF